MNLSSISNKRKALAFHKGFFLMVEGEIEGSRCSVMGSIYIIGRVYVHPKPASTKTGALLLFPIVF